MIRNRTGPGRLVQLTITAVLVSALSAAVAPTAVASAPADTRGRTGDSQAASSPKPVASSDVDRSVSRALPRPRRLDPEFLITNESGFNRVVTGLFALPTTQAQSDPAGLRGRALNAMVTCAGSLLAIEWRLPSSWLKTIKVMRAALAGKAVASSYSFRKALALPSLKAALTETVLEDLAGVHACSEFRMWHELIRNMARSLRYNGQTHALLHVYNREFTGLTLYTCKVQPWWGPDIDNLNRGKTAFLDNWDDGSLLGDCPTEDDWNLSLKKYALLWKAAPF